MSHRRKTTISLSEACRLLGGLDVSLLRYRILSKRWGVRAWSFDPVTVRLSDILAHRDELMRVDRRYTGRPRAGIAAWRSADMAELEARFPAVTRAELIGVLTDAGYAVAEGES